MRKTLRNLKQRNRLLQLYADNQGRGTPLRAEIKNDVGTIFLYDVIDPYFGISALDVAEKIKEVRNASSILVRINSPGGSAFEGRAIASLLQDVADRLDVQVDGLAASAATTIAIQGRSLTMKRGSMFMIHNAETVIVGDKNEARYMADLLDKLDGELSAEYAAISEQKVEDIVAMMNAETWFTPQEAVDTGFADKVDDGNEEDVAPENRSATLASSWNLRAYARAPKLSIHNAAAPAAEPDPAATRAAAGRRLQLVNLRRG